MLNKLTSEKIERFIETGELTLKIDTALFIKHLGIEKYATFKAQKRNNINSDKIKKKSQEISELLMSISDSQLIAGTVIDSDLCNRLIRIKALHSEIAVMDLEFADRNTFADELQQLLDLMGSKSTLEAHLQALEYVSNLIEYFNITGRNVVEIGDWRFESPENTNGETWEIYYTGDLKF